MAELKREKKQLRDAIESTPVDQTGELLWSTRRSAWLLGHEYSQQGCQSGKDYDIAAAATARRNAAYNYHNIR